MQDILITIIVAWILFRLFRPVIFVHHNHYPNHQNHSHNDEVKVTQKPSTSKQSTNSGKDDEYVDFEELPKS